MNRYALVTSARNEEGFIGETIKSVLRQSVLPVEWVIVSDGSTDLTDTIVETFAKDCPWIKLIQRPRRETRNFGAVVENIEMGIQSIGAAYDFIGLLDADLRFGADYFERLIERFNSDKQLGLIGGVVLDPGDKAIPRNRLDVPGAVQFFTRQCFQSLGELVAIPEGGWDALTCATARMNGFRTALIPELIVDHLRPRSVADGGVLRRKYQLGVRDFAIGCHPAFEIIKCVSRLNESPFLLGSCAWLTGFLVSIFRGKRRTSGPLLNFIQAEQIARVKQVLGVRATRCP